MGADTLSFRILGCGSSGGVPRLGPNWGNCDPNEPRNRRSRCSLLVKRFGDDDVDTSVLVDTSPDMRQQLLDAEVNRLDAVLYTHDHADQAHGVDDLRQICYVMRQRVPVYMDEPTAHTLKTRFGYCFEQAPDSNYPAILQAMEMPPCGQGFALDGPGGPLPVTAIDLEHGPVTRALGFRFGNVAYSPDVSGIPPSSMDLLRGLDVWIVDALRDEPHPTHAHLAQTLEWVAHLKPKRTILTNMHITLDYARLVAELPPGVEPAYDGLAFEVPLT